MAILQWVKVKAELLNVCSHSADIDGIERKSYDMPCLQLFLLVFRELSTIVTGFLLSVF